MLASQIYEDRLKLLKAGAFRHLDVEPVPPTCTSAEVEAGAPRGGGAISTAARIPIDHTWRDHERGYAPGEMTTQTWIEDVITVLLGTSSGKLGQSVIVDRFCEQLGLDPTDEAAQHKVSRRVSASLLFLDRVGAVHARERRPATGGRSKRPTLHWQLAEISHGRLEATV
jgi:hypothetical protein